MFRGDQDLSFLQIQDGHMPFFTLEVNISMPLAKHKAKFTSLSGKIPFLLQNYVLHFWLQPTSNNS